MNADDTRLDLDQLTALEAAIVTVGQRACPCGHTADEHSDGGCPCPNCDLRAFEVQQGSVHYRDTDERVTLKQHLDRVYDRRSGS